MSIAWSASSHPGVRRPTNEDSHRERPDLGLFVVADGMGGHVAGEIASRVAVESIETFIDETKSADKNSTWPLPLDTSLSLDGNRLKAAFVMANRRIATMMAGAQALRGMATTASAVLVKGTAASVAHVGDSRVYLLRKGELERLTRDHSWVEEQVRAGTLSEGAAREHPWRNVVTRALSGGADPEVDVADVTLQPGDRVLLCSDGLYSVITDDRIREMLGREGVLAEVCDALIEAANRAGGPDNITTLVLQVDA